VLLLTVMSRDEPLPTGWPLLPSWYNSGGQESLLFSGWEFGVDSGNECDPEGRRRASAAVRRIFPEEDEIVERRPGKSCNVGCDRGRRCFPN
jgi:hypothetical protein